MNDLNKAINFCIQLLDGGIDRQEAVKLSMNFLDIDEEAFIDKVQVELIRRYRESVRGN